MHKLRSSAYRVSAGLVLVLAAIMFFSVQLISTQRMHQQLRVDLAQINNVKYGLLNADVWVAQVTGIIEKKIKEFELTAHRREAVKQSLQRMLEAFINAADAHMRKQAKKGNWWKRTKGAMKQKIQDQLVDIEKIKEGIPDYADKILNEMNKPAGRRQIDSHLQGLIAEVSDSTFSVLDESPLADLHARYHCLEQLSCQRTINLQIAHNHARAMQQVLILFALVFVLVTGVCAAPGAEGSKERLVLLVLCCAALMLCGVLTPMIEVEARISKLHIVLLGESVIFTDQVLYFQSKSVLDVAQVLTATGKPEMILVGVLVAVFSVIFPLAKLTASLIYLYDLKGLRRAAITRFFAFQSGKWSMADVFVVAMLMAYVGFNGIISSQLSAFTTAGGEEVDVLTTNGTSLQIGFFMFLAFCLTSLLTSSLIEARCGTKAQEGKPPSAAA